MPKPKWPCVRVPPELLARVKQEAAAMDKAHAEGRAMLPNEFADGCPLHHVISTALDEKTAHKARSNVRRRPKVES